ncbi:hypothetical protein QM880_01460 [Streptococcus timonensis]|jgi:hypothetical protein|uniref:hypothetical protein n=1 Tax=Streptococcus timonensis TaxID=1852387 RepID=UPI00094E2779|nr:hypothetical protein [Streptococcus timonensis]
MFKEKRNKGFVSGLVLSVILLAVGGLMGFLWNLHQNPTTAFASNSESGKQVKMTVYDIYPEIIGDVDGGSVVYLVQYSQEGDGKYAVIEAKENDAEVKKLIEQATAETLADNPGTLLGTQLQPLSTNVNTSRNNRIVDLSGFLKSVLEPTSTVYQNMNTNVYLSLTEHSRDGWYYIIGAAIFGGMGVFTAITAFILRKKSIASYNELYQTYPELQGNLEGIADQADYYDQDLKVILYKNHLITYFKGTQTVDLREVDQIYLIENSYHRYGFTNKVYQLCYIRKDSPKKHNMTIRTTRTVQEQLEEFWELLMEKFPDIHLGV